MHLCFQVCRPNEGKINIFAKKALLSLEFCVLRKLKLEFWASQNRYFLELSGALWLHITNVFFSFFTKGPKPPRCPPEAQRPPEASRGPAPQRAPKGPRGPRPRGPQRPQSPEAIHQRLWGRRHEAGAVSAQKTAKYGKGLARRCPAERGRRI